MAGARVEEAAAEEEGGGETEGDAEDYQGSNTWNNIETKIALTDIV